MTSSSKDPSETEPSEPQLSPLRRPMTSRQLWFAAAGLWFLITGACWIAYLTHLSERADRAAAAARWNEAVRAVNPPAQEEDPLASPTSSPVDSKRLTADLVQFAVPRSTDSELSAARAFIGHRLMKLGFTPTINAFGSGVNIIAELPGTEPGNGVFIIAAHLDAVPRSPGADDNATGVVGLLELARLFKISPPKSDLRFIFFDAEEKGLIGSRAYVRKPRNLKGVRGAIILEMIGFTCKEPGCQAYPDGVPDFIRPPLGDFVTVIGNSERLDLMKAFAVSQNPKGPMVIALPVPQQGRGMSDTRRSDHAPFWDLGIGAVMVTDTANFRNPHYHKETDTVESLNIDFLTEVVALTHRAVSHLANLPMLEK